MRSSTLAAALGCCRCSRCEQARCPCCSTHTAASDMLAPRLTLWNVGATEVLGVDHSPHLARCARRVLAPEDKAPTRGATHPHVVHSHAYCVFFSCGRLFLGLCIVANFANSDCNMQTNICICIYIYIYTYISMFMSTSMYMCSCVYVYPYVHQVQVSRASSFIPHAANPCPVPS